MVLARNITQVNVGHASLPVAAIDNFADIAFRHVGRGAYVELERIAERPIQLDETLIHRSYQDTTRFWSVRLLLRCVAIIRDTGWWWIAGSQRSGVVLKGDGRTIAMKSFWQRTWLREVLRGGAEGAVYGAMGLAVFITISMTSGGAVGAHDFLFIVPTFIIAGTVICAAGRGISGHYMGAFLGAFAGLFLVGWSAAMIMPKDSIVARQFAPLVGFILGALAGAVLEKLLRSRSNAG